MEVLPSPEYSHLGIHGQLPGVGEGEGDLDGAAFEAREMFLLFDLSKVFWGESC